MNPVDMDDVTNVLVHNQWFEMRENRPASALEPGLCIMDQVLPVGVLVVNRQDAVTLTYGDYA